MARELKTGDVVKTADGTICEVRYVHGDRPDLDPPLPPAADLRVLETGDGFTLPLGELRRIVDPRNRKPPITGMPPADERPRCQRCDRLLAPVVDCVFAGAKASPLAPRITARRFLRWSSYRGLFCTLSCALSFAELAHAAGYRIQRRPASTSATEEQPQ
jgi:hypothetical protein